MTVSRSRAPSAHPATARTIQKRRDKPYKTEQSRVVARKRKLDLHTTYTAAPAGFQFLPVGTPDLAERCKEISRQRGLHVNVVNAKPVSKHAVDPEKVSHHIHRIGYHFRSDVVDDACQELGYTYLNKRFIKEADLQAQNENSRLARAMAKHGLVLDQTLPQQNNEQARAAIMELFPRMPEDDLKAILKHAWEEGTDRVGTNTNIELPRRVQLATIARIRHEYTDYDRLLRAFEWKEARALVEPTCLKKLIEWRGENEDENDNELEEIVRETIVIDDDDDVGPVPRRRGSEADDEDSAADIDQGYASDTSLEISHKPAALEDLGAESQDERSRRFFDRHQPLPRNVQQRYIDVRQKIGLARQQLRNAPAPEQNIVRVHVPQGQTDNDMIMIDGKMFRRAAPSVDVPRSPGYYAATQPSPWIPGQQHGLPPQYVPPQVQSRPALPSDGYASHDLPIPSIEPQDDLRRKAIASASAQQHNGRVNGHRSRPSSPHGSGKRRRLDTNVRNGPSPSAHPQYTSPTDRANRPAEIYGGSPTSVSQMRPHSAGHGSPYGRQSTSTRGLPLPHAAYDPHQPLVRVNVDPNRPGNVVPPHMVTRSGFVDAQVAPIQYVPLPPQYAGHKGHLPQPREGYYAQQPSKGADRSSTRVVYVEHPRLGYEVSQPQHGAPAAVQIAPVTVAPAFPPNADHYVPQPQQYYYPG